MSENCSELCWDEERFRCTIGRILENDQKKLLDDEIRRLPLADVVD